MATTAFTPPPSPVGGGSYVRGLAVTKSDATILNPTRALHIGGTGDLVVVFAGDDTPITLEDVPAGTTLPLCVVKVLAATSATLIVALY